MGESPQFAAMDSENSVYGIKEPGDPFAEESAKRDTRVGRTVRKLFELSMDADPGSYLGAEADLLERLDVSRPTLRQAAKILQNDHLLEIRRGAAGGFYAARPDVGHVIQLPAFYLRMQGASLRQMREASTVIVAETIASAALCEDSDRSAELAEIRASLNINVGDEVATRYIIEVERRLSHLLSRMASNPFLGLFMDILYEFGLLERNLRFYDGKPDRRKEWLGLQQNLCDAVAGGDTEGARKISRARSALIEQWIADDLSPSVQMVKRDHRRGH